MDDHTISSTFLGYDSYGHAEYDTQYSPIGGLLYRLKSKGDVSVVDQIVATATDFLRKWSIGFTAIVPVPPSNAARVHQPVTLIGKAIAESLGLEWLETAIRKVKKTPQLKDVFDVGKRSEILAGAFSVNPKLVSGKRVLLFDDLYRSGATMNEIASLLYEQGEASGIYSFAITRTRKKR